MAFFVSWKKQSCLTCKVFQLELLVQTCQVKLLVVLFDQNLFPATKMAKSLLRKSERIYNSLQLLEGRLEIIFRTKMLNPLNQNQLASSKKSFPTEFCGQCNDIVTYWSRNTFRLHRSHKVFLLKKSTQNNSVSSLKALTLIISFEKTRQSAILQQVPTCQKRQKSTSEKLASLFKKWD